MATLCPGVLQMASTIPYNILSRQSHLNHEQRMGFDSICRCTHCLVGVGTQQCLENIYLAATSCQMQRCLASGPHGDLPAGSISCDESRAHAIIVFPVLALLRKCMAKKNTSLFVSATPQDMYAQGHLVESIIQEPLQFFHVAILSCMVQRGVTSAMQYLCSVRI